MKKNTILFFVLLIAASLLLFIHTFSVLAHTPERTGGEGLWVNFLMNLPCCILIGYADYRVAKSLQKRFPDRNVIRIASSILLTALPVGLFAVAINYAIARLYAHPFSIAGSVFPIMLWNSLIVLFIELFFYNRRQIEQQRRLALMEKEKALYHFETLKNQINPHFLYNTLESITWMVEAQENEAAVRMISELAKLLRVSLSRGKTIIPIKDELQHSRSYMNIQLARYKERFKTEFRIEEEIENYCIVKLVIQPILENAIYYGVGNMDEDDGGMIIVSGKKKDEDILITIEDNGMGMREEVLENILTDNSKVPKHGSGVGVINVHSRIRLMFGEEYGLSIESEPDEGTRVTIRIPAIPYTPENAEALELQKYIQRRPGR